MNEIWNAIIQYDGEGFLLIFYVLALVWLYIAEKDKINRILLCYLPTLMTVLFLMPPFYRLYARLEGADTYYRILWLLPITITISGAVVRAFHLGLVKAVLLACVLFALTGSYTYHNENIVAAENRLHIPQMVLNITDLVMNDTKGERAMVAMPVGLVQFVRQYDTRILMPYGREMQMPQWEQYDVDNRVYEEMNSPAIHLDRLASVCTEYNCRYIVLETARVLSFGQDEIAGHDLVPIAETDGYTIYRNEAVANELIQ